MSGLIEDVVKVAAGGATAAGGLLSGIVPWAIGAMATVIAALSFTIGIYHYATIPHLEAQLAEANAALTTANDATARANENAHECQAKIDEQNKNVDQLAADRTVASNSAAAVALSLLTKALKPLPAVPVENSAAAINQFWSSTP